VAGAQQREVAMVEAGELGYVETFDDREDGSVDEPDVGVRVAIAQLTGSCVVGGMQHVRRSGGANAEAPRNRPDRTLLRVGPREPVGKLAAGNGPGAAGSGQVPDPAEHLASALEPRFVQHQERVQDQRPLPAAARQRIEL
jgi:hypothetical protein